MRSRRERAGQVDRGDLPDGTAEVVRAEPHEVATDGDRPWAWVEASSLADLPMPDANRAVLRALRWRLP